MITKSKYGIPTQKMMYPVQIGCIQSEYDVPSPSMRHQSEYDAPSLSMMHQSEYDGFSPSMM
ncbi:hypothetical protein DPMN_012822 [Dreissena polymorpha]|uniref:Uncharacterized protein n=1 Tax=Dreissena polymorpha TaxID=45954 RepID=A0A9D4S3Q7_DREPO|nr:hypothetical protein DPMN_012822 [Dreissena polymorpha]